jgi:hypothetical protein
VTLSILVGRGTCARSTLAWERPDSEDVLDLSAVANNPLALSVIDRLSRVTL